MEKGKAISKQIGILVILFVLEYLYHLWAEPQAISFNLWALMMVRSIYWVIAGILLAFLTLEGRSVGIDWLYLGLSFGFLLSLILTFTPIGYRLGGGFVGNNFALIQTLLGILVGGNFIRGLFGKKQ